MKKLVALAALVVFSCLMLSLTATASAGDGGGKPAKAHKAPGKAKHHRHHSGGYGG